MKKRRAHRAHSMYSKQPVAWLPVDSRLFPFFSFSHVRGTARVFLTVEMILAVLIVTGTFVFVVVHCFH